MKDDENDGSTAKQDADPFSWCCDTMSHFAGNHMTIHLDRNIRSRREWKFCPWCGKPLPENPDRIKKERRT